MLPAVADYRMLARKRLARIAPNRAAFDSVLLLPRILRDEFETILRLLGCNNTTALDTTALCDDYPSRLAQA